MSEECVQVLIKFILCKLKAVGLAAALIAPAGGSDFLLAIQ